MWNADKLGYRGNTNYNRAYEGDELVWEKQDPFPANNEIWYTSTDDNIVQCVAQNILSNTYKDGKGIIVFNGPTINMGAGASGVKGFNKQENLKTVVFPIDIDYTLKIPANCFEMCRNLKTAILPTNLIFSKAGTFWAQTFNYCSTLEKIIYNGTIAQWQSIDKGRLWGLGIPDTAYVQCTDGNTSI